MLQKPFKNIFNVFGPITFFCKIFSEPFSVLVTWLLSFFGHLSNRKQQGVYNFVTVNKNFVHCRGHKIPWVQFNKFSCGFFSVFLKFLHINFVTTRNDLQYNMNRFINSTSTLVIVAEISEFEKKRRAVFPSFELGWSKISPNFSRKPYCTFLLFSPIISLSPLRACHFFMSNL